MSSVTDLDTTDQHPSEHGPAVIRRDDAIPPRALASRIDRATPHRFQRDFEAAGRGFGREEARPMREATRQDYRGSPHSFGHSARPHRADQDERLAPFGAPRLSAAPGDEDRPRPEEDARAIVARHPQTKYFTL